ncbi:hypothetical protein AB0E01_43565 [Nocardia vinacea]|uniref:hypothetical protein n=1 Tax=Nocardia vinacea TaxID=96468 RepID=UPI0033D6DE48
MSYRVIRRTAGVLSAVAAIMTAQTGTGLASPAHAGVPHCSFQPDGLISTRWQLLAQHYISIGCPITGEMVPEHIPPGFPPGMGEDLRAQSRHQLFEHGDIVWSPHQGGEMTVAAVATDDGNIYVEWGPATPFSYDRFIVSVDGSQNNTPGGRSGKTVRSPGRGTHLVVVEGCDGHSTCLQGWTVPAQVRVP